MSSSDLRHSLVSSRDVRTSDWFRAFWSLTKKPATLVSRDQEVFDFPDSERPIHPDEQVPLLSEDDGSFEIADLDVIIETATSRFFSDSFDRKAG